MLSYSKHLHAAAAWLEGRGLDREYAADRGFGVVVDPIPGHEHLVGRLAIPYLTKAGPVNMTFRCIEDHDCKAHGHGKYMQSKGLDANLWGVQCVAWADEWIILTEGELDAFTWQQIGWPALGVSGASKWQDYWVNVLEDFSRVYVIAEGDTAGENFWSLVSSKVTNAIKVRLPAGEDSNSLFIKEGAEALTSRIRK